MNEQRNSPVELGPEKFKELGHFLVDAIAEHLEHMEKDLVTTGKRPAELAEIIGTKDIPEEGVSPDDLLKTASEILLRDSLFNGHPKFLGYITSSAAPLGVLGDLLASGINQNMGAQILSPMATEIEKQTVRWLAQFIGLSSQWGGLLVSGGNMANLTAYLAARRNKAGDALQENGLRGLDKNLITYCSRTTHTWVEKAVTLFGHGKKSLRWIDTDESNKMDLKALKEQISTDINSGDQPIMVIGTAGDVSTGAVDDLEGLAAISKEFDLWFHVDGAYGAPAAVLPELGDLFYGLDLADSIALDPHKWLYSPLEAGCTLVKDPRHLVHTFSSRPDYYNFKVNEEESTNFFEFGMQNSRGFRALKVWLALQQVGKNGYIQSIREDIVLAEYLYDLCSNHPELSAMSCKLSIATFRYVPKGFEHDSESSKEILNRLNEELVNHIQGEGRFFVSNAIVRGYYCLRACVVNFRTSRSDMEELVAYAVECGRQISRSLKA